MVAVTSNTEIINVETRSKLVRLTKRLLQDKKDAVSQPKVALVNARTASALATTSLLFHKELKAQFQTLKRDYIRLGRLYNMFQDSINTLRKSQGYIGPTKASSSESGEKSGSNGGLLTSILSGIGVLFKKTISTLLVRPLATIFKLLAKLGVKGAGFVSKALGAGWKAVKKLGSSVFRTGSNLVRRGASSLASRASRVLPRVLPFASRFLGGSAIRAAGGAVLGALGGAAASTVATAGAVGYGSYKLATYFKLSEKLDSVIERISGGKFKDIADLFMGIADGSVGKDLVSWIREKLGSFFTDAAEWVKTKSVDFLKKLNPFKNAEDDDSTGESEKSAKQAEEEKNNQGQELSKAANNGAGGAPQANQPDTSPASGGVSSVISGITDFFTGGSSGQSGLSSAISSVTSTVSDFFTGGSSGQSGLSSAISSVTSTVSDFFTGGSSSSESSSGSSVSSGPIGNKIGQAAAALVAGNRDSFGKCARGAVFSLGNAGIPGFPKPRGVPGKPLTWGPSGVETAISTKPVLLKRGFSQISAGGAPQNGDVEILGPRGNKTSNEKAGHIQIFYNGSWYSDFKQNNPGRARSEGGAYAWRERFRYVGSSGGKSLPAGKKHEQDGRGSVEESPVVLKNKAKLSLIDTAEGDLFPDLSDNEVSEVISSARHDKTEMATVSAASQTNNIVESNPFFSIVPGGESSFGPNTNQRRQDFSPDAPRTTRQQQQQAQATPFQASGSVHQDAKDVRSPRIYSASVLSISVSPRYM